MELEHATEAFAQAESAVVAKDLALSRLAHELRTPVNAVLLWADLLGGENAAAEPDRLARAITAIRQSAQEQHEIIERWLTFARSPEAG